MKAKSNNVAFADIQKYFLLAITLVLLVLFLQFLSPFFSTLIIAGVFAAATFPFNVWLEKKVKNRTLGTLITVLGVTVILLAPFTAFFFFVAQEGAAAYTIINENINQYIQGDVGLLPEKLQDSFVVRWFEIATQYVPITPESVFGVIRDAIDKVSALLVTQTTNVLKQLSLFVLFFLIFLLSFFYFLRDGKALIHHIKAMIPLPHKHRDELFEKLNVLSKGIIYGFFGAAIAQGFLAGVGFSLAGISNAAFWGTVMAFFSPIPYLGTSLIWVPAVIVLIVKGHFIAAFFLLVWSATIVGTADNIVKPYIIGKTSAIHPLAVLLILLGGVFVFGLKGLILGPFLLTLLLGFLHIYKLEYKAVLKD